MNLTFDDEFDIVNELPDALRAISYLVEAVPYYQHGVGTNEKAEKKCSLFFRLINRRYCKRCRKTHNR